MRLITTHTEAQAALATLARQPVGLDLETTGLNPLTSYARLLQVAPMEGETLVIDLPKVGGLVALRDEIQRLWPICHNALFEMRFLQHAGVITTPDCTLLANHALNGRPESLEVLAERHLGRKLDKRFQTSDWSGELSREQLEYAATDAEVMLPLWRHLERAVEDHHLEFLYRLMVNAQSSVTMMHLAGKGFVRADHSMLCFRLRQNRDALAEPLIKALGFNPDKVLKTKIKPGLPRNPNSSAQLGAWLVESVPAAVARRWPKTKTGKLATGADDLNIMLDDELLPDKVAAVIGDLLIPYKVVEKQLSAFGPALRNYYRMR